MLQVVALIIHIMHQPIFLFGSICFENTYNNNPNANVLH